MSDLIFPRSRAPVQSVFGRAGAVVAASGDYAATQITFTPFGFVADTDTQAALQTIITALNGLNESIDDRVAALLVAGSNVTLNYNDGANTLTISAAGVTNEQIDDRVAALLVAGSNVTLTYNDGANTLTIDAAASGLTMEQIEDNLAAGVIISGYNTLIEYDDAANTFTWHEAERICSDADGATITFDLSDDHSDANAGAYHATEPITQDCTLAVINAGIGAGNAPGKRFQLRLNYDAVGGHSITFFSPINWVNGYPPATTPVGGSGDTFEFLVTAIDEYGVPSFDGWILSTERGVMRFGTLGVTSNAAASWSLDQVAGNARTEAVGGLSLLETNGSVNSSTTAAVGTRSVNMASTAVGHYLAVSSASAIVGGARNITLSLWFYANSNDNYVLATKGGFDAGTFDYALWMSSSQRLGFSMNDGTGAVIYSSPSDLTGSWHHLVGVYDHGQSRVFLYLDGDLVGTSAVVGTPVDHGHNFCIGHDDGFSDVFRFDGLLDQVDFFAEALSGDQVASLYNAGAGMVYPQNLTDSEDLDWSVCEGTTITVTGSGTHTLTHRNPIPLKTLRVAVLNSGASGTLSWAGVSVDWGSPGAPALPADGQTLWLEFVCKTVTDIKGKVWFPTDRGGTPTIAVGSGGGTGATASISGTDGAGEITLNTGTTPTAGATALTVTFSAAFGAAPSVVFSPSNALAALLSGVSMIYVTSTTTTFVFSAGSTALTGSSTYKWKYQVR